VLVQRQGLRLDAMMVEQLARVARVLAGDQIDAAQGFQGAQRDVAEVSDRVATTYNADDIQCAFHVRHSCTVRLPALSGRRPSKLAADYLQGQGLGRADRSWRATSACRGGEIDLVCRDGASTVFVEVRLRSRRISAARRPASRRQAGAPGPRRTPLAAAPRRAPLPLRLRAARRRNIDWIEWLRDALASDFCCCWPALLLGTAQAGEVRILVQSSPLAGFQYYAGESLWHEMREGDRLCLVREAGQRARRQRGARRMARAEAGLPAARREPGRGRGNG
jgi:Holliday junction resolvase-like predicted endonuclease